MKLFKALLFFCFGGAAYVGLELLWRGRSHRSMFLAGGTCFLLLGNLSRRKNPAVRALGSTGIITSVELLTGLLANRDHRVWDYRNMPWNFRGQICLAFSLLWIPLGLLAMALYRLLEKPFRQVKH